RRDGATLGLSRPLDGVTTGLIRLRSEFTNFSALPLDPSDPVPCGPAPDPRCPPPSLLTPGRVVSFQLSAIRDTRNSRFAPTSGDRILASAELAPPHWKVLPRQDMATASPLTRRWARSASTWRGAGSMGAGRRGCLLGHHSNRKRRWNVGALER